MERKESVCMQVSCLLLAHSCNTAMLCTSAGDCSKTTAMDFYGYENMLTYWPSRLHCGDASRDLLLLMVCFCCSSVPQNCLFANNKPSALLIDVALKSIGVLLLVFWHLANHK